MQEVTVGVIAERMCRSVEHKPRGKDRGRGLWDQEREGSFCGFLGARGLGFAEPPSQMAFQ